MKITKANASELRLLARLRKAGWREAKALAEAIRDLDAGKMRSMVGGGEMAPTKFASGMIAGVARGRASGAATEIAAMAIAAHDSR